MASQPSPALECGVFAERLERRFADLATAEEQKVGPDERRVDGWNAAAMLAAGIERRNSVEKFAAELTARMNQRELTCDCGKVPVTSDDHATWCNWNIWSRASWVVQQELDDVLEPEE